MSECPHYTDVGTCRVRGEPVVQGEQKRCQTPLGMRFCYDYQRARAEAAEAEATTLRVLIGQFREFAQNVTERAADFKVGPHHVEGPFWDLVCWLYEYATEQVDACDAIATNTDEWTPTSQNINALPDPLRRFIHDLETRCDPAGEVAALTLTGDQNAQLQAECERLKGVSREATP